MFLHGLMCPLKVLSAVDRGQHEHSDWWMTTRNLQKSLSINIFIDIYIYINKAEFKNQP